MNADNQKAVNDRINQEKDLFAEALDLPPEQREGFLRASCQSDPAMMQRVRVLLEMHGSAEVVLPDRPNISTTEVGRELPGTVIGRYKLLEQIGEGGFGVVFRAEQMEPVRREVALKVIKAGMDTRQVIARFEAERQALAMMDHPNIAKVLDAGATESPHSQPLSHPMGEGGRRSGEGFSPLRAGRPYFVMELVRGVPITKFCEEHQLTLKERIELFIPVCQAIQHAHQKGVIHRDIKPSNVLVALPEAGGQRSEVSDQRSEGSQSLPRDGRDGFHSVPRKEAGIRDAVERVPTPISRIRLRNWKKRGLADA